MGAGQARSASPGPVDGSEDDRGDAPEDAAARSNRVESYLHAALAGATSPLSFGSSLTAWSKALLASAHLPSFT